MKTIFLIDDTIINKISYYHLAAFLIALPFDFFYSELILISFALHTIINLKKTTLKNIFSWPVLLITSVFLLACIATLYSPNKAEAIKVTTRQLAILLIPLLFAITDLDIKKYIISLICILGFTCTVTIGYLYATALQEIYLAQLPLSTLFTGAFMNHHFSMPIQMHATYLSMYTTFSLLSFSYLVLSNSNLKYRWVYIISIAILAAGMLQLSSRAVFISFLVIINFVFPFLLYRGKKRIVFFLLALSVSTLAFILISNAPSFKERYISELKTDLTDTNNIIDNDEPRLARWDAIMELVKESPVIGFGSGSEEGLLQEQFFQKKLFISFLNEFNAHNQYLSFLLQTGIIGLALFIYVLYRGITTAVQKKDIIFLSFMVLISIVSISENILDLNKGIFFYSFFLSLFLIDNKIDGENRNSLTTKTGNLQ